MGEPVGPRSAIIVPLRIPAPIERIRQAAVPVAGLGVAPHVTVLSPFAPPARLDAATRATLASIAGSEKVFSVSLDQAARFPGVLWLDPAPVEPFHRLIVAVCATFPAYPPYGDPTFRPDEVAPHVTVALGDDKALDALEPDVRAALPATARASSLDVIVEGPDGHWRRLWRLPLRR
jgi:2'-5' RNA ligase